MAKKKNLGRASGSGVRQERKRETKFHVLNGLLLPWPAYANRDREKALAEALLSPEKPGKARKVFAALIDAPEDVLVRRVIRYLGEVKERLGVVPDPSDWWKAITLQRLTDAQAHLAVLIARMIDRRTKLSAARPRGLSSRIATAAEQRDDARFSAEHFLNAGMSWREVLASIRKKFPGASNRTIYTWIGDLKRQKRK